MEKIRFAVITIIAVLLLGAFSPKAAAQFDETVIKAGDYTKSEIQLMYAIEKCIQNRDSGGIDLRSYNIDKTRFEEIYGVVYFNHPDFFYVSATTAYMDYSRTTKKMRSFAPVFLYSKETTARYARQIDSIANDLIKSMGKGMTDVEKLLYIHDYIISECDYSEEGVRDSGDNGRNIYDTLVKKKAVCVGYSLTMQYFCDKLGITNITVTSADHIWNMVRLSGKWYYIDNTWDDMLTGSPNFVAHFLFLVSENAMEEYYASHGDYFVSYDADSEKYDDMFWEEVICKMNYYNGYWYYAKEDGLYRYSFSGNREQKLVDISDVWYSTDGRSYSYSFSKTCISGKYLFYSTKYNVIRYDLNTGSKDKVYTLDRKGDYAIYDIQIKNGKLVVYSSDDDENMGKVKKIVSIKGLSNTDTTYHDDMGLRASKSGDKITLRWDSDPDAEQYYVYRYNKSTKKYTRIATVADNSYTFKKTGKDNNCEYAIRIRTAEGLSGFSATKGV